MAQSDIHKLIEGYFNATLSEQEEAQLRILLSHTNEDSSDIREAKAIMGIFSTNRILTGNKLPEKKTKSVWGKMKYAAMFIFGILLDIFVDSDDFIDNKLTK